MRVPSGRSRTGLALSVTDHSDSDVIGLVHDGAVRDSKTVAEFTTLVDGTRSLSVHLLVSFLGISARRSCRSPGILEISEEDNGGHT